LTNKCVYGNKHLNLTETGFGST